MRIFAISDLHLSFEVDKPMDIFGGLWLNHTKTLEENWQSVVKEDDLVLVAGDLSWAMRIEDTKQDFEYLERLNGNKIIIRGNHEYWWKSISAVREILPPSVKALQNDAIKVGNYVITGTRGWYVPESQNDPKFTAENKKIFDREVIRLELCLEAAKKLANEGDTIICMMHFPPFNHKREENAFTQLFEKYGVKKVVYAHLHKNRAGYPLTCQLNGIDYYLTSADLVEMKPVEIV